MALNTVSHTGSVRQETQMTATGNSQSTAAPLANNTEHEFTTVGAGTGCILPIPTPSPPSQVTIYNAGANPLLVYPALGGTINGGGVNGSVSIASGTGANYWAAGLLTWYSTQTASAGGGGTVNSGTSGQVAYYASSTTAVSGESLSSLIDAATGNAQGDVLYRGASSWAVLPPGTAGQVLTTGGASANPSWAAGGGGGSGTVNSGTTNELAYYAGAGTAVSGASASSLLDTVFGNTQGSTLYRGASSWSALAPPTPGTPAVPFALTSTGPSANPSWTIYSPTPVRKVSLQGLGIATTNPASISGGPDVSATLQAIANESGAYNVIVCDGGLYTGKVSLPSGRGVEGTGGRWKGPGYPMPLTGLVHPASSVYCVRNANWLTDVATTDGTDANTTYVSPLYSNIIDQDITIRDLFIHGNFGHAAGNSAYDPTGAIQTFFTTDPFGLLYGVTPQGSGSWPCNRYQLITFGGVTIAIQISTMHFHGVRNLILENCSSYYPAAATAELSYIDGAYISNVSLENPSALGLTNAGVLDSFGINAGVSVLWFRGTNRGLRIHSLSGTTSDDFLAFNAEDGGGNSTYTGTAQKAGYAAYFLDYVYANGPITDVIVDGIDSNACENLIRFLTGGDSISHGGRAKIDGVTANNIRGTVYGAIVRLDNEGYAPSSSIGNICLSNFNVTSSIDPAYLEGGTHSGCIPVAQNINTLALSNWIINDSGNMSASPLFNLEAGAAVTNLIANNVMVNGYAAIVNTLATSGASITNCVVSNSEHVNKGSGLASIYDGAVGIGMLTGTGNGAVTLHGIGWNASTWGSSTTPPFSAALTPLADSTVNVILAGTSWHSTTAGGRVTCRAIDGSSNTLITMDDGTFFKCTACTALANSASQATLLTSPAASWGSLTIPNGALMAGQCIDIEFQALASTIGTPTLTLYVLFGGVTVLSAMATTGSGLANAAVYTCGPVAIQARTVGASGSMNGSGLIEGITYLITTPSFGADVGSINFNQANALDFQAKWGTGSSSNTIQVLSFTARLRG